MAKSKSEYLFPKKKCHPPPPPSESNGSPLRLTFCLQTTTTNGDDDIGVHAMVKCSVQLKKFIVQQLTDTGVRKQSLIPELKAGPLR